MIRWDIRTPNPMLPLQAASLGETMRRNRMQEQRQARMDEAAASKAEEEARRYGLQQTRAAMNDYARLVKQVATLPPEQQDAAFGRGMEILESVHPARNGVNPWATVTRRLEAGEPESMAALAPFLDAAQVAKPLLKQGINPETGAVEWFDFSSGAPAATGLTAPPRQPLVSVGGTQWELQSTPEGLAAVRLNEQTGEFESTLVSRKPGTAETEVERAEGRRAAILPQGEALISDYEVMVGAAPTTGGFVEPGGKREALNQQRQALVAWVAKNILGTPGAEPSPALYEQAEGLVPDYSGPYDRAVFTERMNTLRRMMTAGVPQALPAQESVQRTEVPGDIPRVASDADFDALPPGARFQAPDGTIRQKPGG